MPKFTMLDPDGESFSYDPTQLVMAIVSGELAEEPDAELMAAAILIRHFQAGDWEYVELDQDEKILLEWITAEDRKAPEVVEWMKETYARHISTGRNYVVYDGQYRQNLKAPE